MSIIQKLLESISEIIVKEREKELQKPGKICLLSMFRHYYENSHSDLLAILLDSNENNHKHKDEYLKAFLKQVRLEKLIQYDLMKCTINREKNRIDISISHPDFYIIIENKINAIDQPNQLARYYNSALQNIEEDKIHILYLTKFGTEPTDITIQCDEKSMHHKAKVITKKLDDKQMIYIIDPTNSIKCISYHTHILKWLESFEFSKNEVLLESAIIQYKYAIEIITNQTEEEQTMNESIKEELNKILVESPTMWETISYIEQARNDIIQDKLNKYKKEIPGSYIWQNFCVKDCATSIGKYAIDLCCDAKNIIISVFNRDKCNDINILSKFLKDNNITFDKKFNGRIATSFLYSDENKAIVCVQKLNAVLDDPSKIKVLKEMLYEKYNKLIKLVERLQNVKLKHGIVYLYQQGSYDLDEDIISRVEAGDNNCIGVGIPIIRDKLTLAIEFENGQYNFGLMAHGIQHDDVKEKLKKLDIKLDRNKYWYVCDSVDLDTEVDTVLDMIISKYDQVKNIK